MPQWQRPDRARGLDARGLARQVEGASAVLHGERSSPPREVAWLPARRVEGDAVTVKEHPEAAW